MMAFVSIVNAQSPQVKKQLTMLYQDVEAARKNGQMLFYVVTNVIKRKAQRA